MTNKRRIIAVICSIIVFPLFLVLFSSNNTSALSEQELYRKALLNAAKLCYGEGKMVSNIDSDGPGSYDGFSTLFTETYLKSNDYKKEHIYLPSQIGGNNLSDSKKNLANCLSIFQGDKASGFATRAGSLDGLFDLYGKSAPLGTKKGTDAATVGAFLKGFGYTVETQKKEYSDSNICIRFFVNENADREGSTPVEYGKMCFNDELSDDTGQRETKMASYMNKNGTVELSVMVYYPADGLIYKNININSNACGDSATNAKYFDGVDKDDIKTLAAGMQCAVGNTADGNYMVLTTEVSEESVEATSSYKNYSVTDKDKHTGTYTNAYGTMAKYLTGSSATAFSDSDIYDLYTLYLNKVYNVQINDNIECSDTKPKAYTTVVNGSDAYYMFTSRGWCAVMVGEDADATAKVTGFKNQKFYLDYEFTFTELLEALFEIDESKVDPTDPSVVTDPDGEEHNDPNCMDRAGSLGWILCPVIDTLKEFITERYAEMVEPALQINIELINKDSSTFKAWVVFQGIANLLFVVLFIIVVFSQLTGFGIDNYGIKKILPKLIIGAVLINLSYIICQLAVDVFNIIGGGIGALFRGIGASMDTDTIVIGEASVDKTAWSSFWSSGWNPVLTAIIAACGAAVVLTQGLAIIVPVLLLFITVAFSIISLIVILGIRQAAAVLLVVVSPVAFAFYMLPNTKPIFDKWFKFFKGLLIAYPICSALIYGGDLASRILMTAGGAGGQFWMTVSAAAISVAPIFLIPKIITGSLGAISAFAAGFIGGKIGGGLKGKAQKALNNNGVINRRKNYNDMVRQQKREARNSEYGANKAQKVLDGKGIFNRRMKGKDPSQMSASQRRRYNSALSTVNARNQEMEKMWNDHFKGKSDDDIMAALEGAGDKLDENMLVAGLSSMNDADNLFKVFSNISGNSNVQKMLASADTRDRVSQVFRGRNDVVNNSVGKLLSKGALFKKDGSGAIDMDALRSKVGEAGTGVMAGIDKDAFKIRANDGGGSLFSADQLRAAATAGYSGSTQANFSDMMRDSSVVSAAMMQEIVTGLSAQQITSLDDTAVQTLGGIDNINNFAADSVRTLMAPGNEELRARAVDGGVISRLDPAPTDTESSIRTLASQLMVADAATYGGIDNSKDRIAAQNALVTQIKALSDHKVLMPLNGEKRPDWVKRVSGILNSPPPPSP